MKLKDYIYKYYRNNQRAFADAIKRSPQMVTHYIKQGYEVVGGRLIDVKLEIPGEHESEFDRGVAAMCCYIFDNGEAIPGEELQRIELKVIANNKKEFAK